MLWKDIWLRWNAFDENNYYVQKYSKSSKTVQSILKDTFGGRMKFSDLTQTSL